MPKVPPLLSTADAARLLGRDVRTVHRMVQRAELQPAAKAPGLRGAYLFRREDVQALAVKERRAAVPA